MPGARNNLRTRPWDVAATELIDEVVATAASIAAACASSGERVFPDDAESRLLRAVAGSSYCLAIADVARTLRISRQAAHRLVHDAVAAGKVELLPNHGDRRILQVFLTAQGRAELARVRTAEGIWLQLLLSGLADRQMAVVTHVLRVIRQRLERDERERRRVESEERERRRLSRDRFFR
jgi:DNA-binding MarR family transcriptional regulator